MKLFNKSEIIQTLRVDPVVVILEYLKIRSSEVEYGNETSEVVEIC